MNPKLSVYIEEVLSQKISEERKKVLQPLIDFIQEKVKNQESVNINFICTHNSRRSHLAQIWAQTASDYFKISNIYCYSGGTEATALFPKVADTLINSGFNIWKLNESENPIYSIKYSQNALPIIGFSKKYDDAFNPDTDFVAVMTCSQADGGCPFIGGAERRIVITYEDPKISDDTPKQQEIYKERSLEIGAEMFYVFSKISC
ncbi:protein-tyrosine-phosphatase [Chryseobacterium joostei]|uniref:Arsenate reductase n=1 Tax=Chryseobacterium joostei TaxID=112234 RepID=A0A1N7I3Z0_9FLAO|nr:protein-tyrosine-phosphatase [Chryseobacterium joostei]AZA99844.1 protein-tyrosine-phosphatase [Chryseobacterium joostei]SIS31750.1 arsenate reductase [Chryseobacterium joostei]